MQEWPSDWVEDAVAARAADFVDPAVEAHHCLVHRWCVTAAGGPLGGEETLFHI